jgi:hypothetical protein
MTDSAHTETRTQTLAAAGVPQPSPGLPPERLAQVKKAAEAQIDEFMRQLGYKNPLEQTDEHGWRYLQVGSAEGRAGITESDGELFLRVEAKVMPNLPSDKELIVPLMRELLELNMDLSGSLRLGIRDEGVFATSTRPLMELRSNDFVQSVYSVMELADTLDDTLIQKYGGTAKRRAEPSAPATESRKRKTG